MEGTYGLRPCPMRVRIENRVGMRPQRKTRDHAVPAADDIERRPQTVGEKHQVACQYATPSVALDSQHPIRVRVKVRVSVRQLELEFAFVPGIEKDHRRPTT